MSTELPTRPAATAALPTSTASSTAPTPSTRPSLARRLGTIAAETALVLGCLITGFVLLGTLMEDPGVSEWWIVLDGLLGLLATCCLPARRLWPLAVALGLAATTLLSAVAVPAALVALFTIARRRPWRQSLVPAGVLLAASVGSGFIHPSGELTWWQDAVLIIAVTVVLVVPVLGWGAYRGTRDELIAALRQRALDAEADLARRQEQARARERTRIAREMHDVLAHRISLVSLHAGALEVAVSAPLAERTQAAAAVRASAHAALEDLREVLGVLRADSVSSSEAEPGITGSATRAESLTRAEASSRATATTTAGSAADTGGMTPLVAYELSTDQQRPQPDLAALAELIDQARRAGTDVVLRLEVGEQMTSGAEATDVPTVSAVSAVTGVVARTAYRVVQEGLTNARKHAPGHQVLVLVRRIRTLTSTNTSTAMSTDQARHGAQGLPALEVVVEDTPPGDGLSTAPSDAAAWFLTDAAAQRGSSPTPGAGLGLVGLRERVELVDGDLQHGRVAGGFRLRALLPLPVAQHGAPGADDSGRSSVRGHHDYYSQHNEHHQPGYGDRGGAPA